MDISLVDLFLVVLVNGLVDCTLVAWISGKQSKKAIIGALQDPDEEVQKALANLVAQSIPLVLSAQLPTGKMITDEDGKEHPETVDLLSFAGRTIANQLLYKIKASRGGLKSQAGADFAEATGLDSSLLGGIVGPRKGQSTLEWGIEQMLPRLQPKLEEIIAKKLEQMTSGNQL